jgi:hypothetical protein
MDRRILLRNGVMGEWSIGAMGIREKILTHYSITPVLQYSNFERGGKYDRI